MNKKNLAVLGGALITLSAVGAVICSSVTIYMSNKVSGRVSSVQSDVTALSRAYIQQEEKKDDPQYVTIGSTYEIRDTSAISDAYLKKNDSKLTKPEDKETLKMASELLSQITNDNMSLYEKELAIHDWLVTNLTHPDDSLSAVPNGSGPSFTPYGVLKYKKAVCVGYATTFKLLMNMLGADCMVEHNLSLTHSWDVVKLDDNQWYIVDAYMDGDSSNLSKNLISHQKFNVTNDVINSGDPEFDTSLYPVASSTKYSYAAQNFTKITNIKTLPKTIKSLIDKDTSEAYFELPKNTDYKFISAMMRGIGYRLTEGTSIDARYVTLDKNTVILCLFFTSQDNDDGDEKNYPDLSNELDQLFGQGDSDSPAM